VVFLEIRKKDATSQIVVIGRRNRYCINRKIKLPMDKNIYYLKKVASFNIVKSNLFCIFVAS
jgi:hypothetical protein